MISRTIVSNMIPLIGAFFIVQTIYANAQIVLAKDKDLAVCVFQVIVDTPEGSADDTPFSMCWKIK